MFSRSLIWWSYIALISILLFSINACSRTAYEDYTYETFYSRAPDPLFSFEYSADYQLFPHSRFLFKSGGPMPPRLTGGVLISIATYEGLDSNHLDSFIAYMNAQKGIIFFSKDERRVIHLDSIEAESIHYGYNSYDTAPVTYEGTFISFMYKEFVIDVDFLSYTGSLLLDEAVNHFIETFKILD